jgi:hypothetical protein
MVLRMAKMERMTVRVVKNIFRILLVFFLGGFAVVAISDLFAFLCMGCGRPKSAILI